ncbi:MAG: DUF2892 domain-containing protein [Nocardioides marinisabuli]|uniref:YgaP family membrane protein n=1 Tax=Nocardioides marinisabuli TaxID=419476 RepID=UPI00321BDDB5
MSTMTLERAVMMFAGAMTLLSAALAASVSPWWLLLTAFVGLNQVQSSVTGFCPAAIVMRRAGLQPACAVQSAPLAR